MSMYVNKSSIGLILRLRSALGNRVAQTNSRFNGNYINSVRVYADPSHRGKPKLSLDSAYTLDDLKTLADKYAPPASPTQSP